MPCLPAASRAGPPPGGLPQRTEEPETPWGSAWEGGRALEWSLLPPAVGAQGTKPSAVGQGVWGGGVVWLGVTVWTGGHTKLPSNRSGRGGRQRLYATQESQVLLCDKQSCLWPVLPSWSLEARLESSHCPTSQGSRPGRGTRVPGLPPPQLTGPDTDAAVTDGQKGSQASTWV